MTPDTDYCQVACLCDDYIGMKPSNENSVADGQIDDNSKAYRAFFFSYLTFWRF